MYRICKINSMLSACDVLSACLNLKLDLAPDFVKPYKINDKMINQAFELMHGKSVRIFNMDKVSNGPFLEVGAFCKAV